MGIGDWGFGKAGGSGEGDEGGKRKEIGIEGAGMRERKG